MTKVDNMILGIALASRDYGWSEPKTDKRFTLVNPMDAKNLELSQVASCFCGTGHCEWEYLLAYHFLTAIEKAAKEGKPEADLTQMLNRDLLATRGRVFPQNVVVNHILKWFIVESDNPSEMRLRLRM